MVFVLTRPLALEVPQDAPDGAGGRTRNWAVAGTLWAHVKATGASAERWSNGAVQARQVYRITVRAAPVGSPQRPAPDQRFRDGARVFRILAVADADPRGKYLSCLSEEVTAS